MRKTIAWLLTLVMVIALGSTALATGELITMEDAGQPADPGIGIQRGTQITVGSTTPMSGYFGLDMWGNNTADIDVRYLIHGYHTIVSTREMGLTVNPTAVTGIESVDGADGSRTYTIQIKDGLTYNDGTAITAKDYVFYLLLSGSPIIEQLGGTPKGLEHIVGYDAYKGGGQTLSGLRLLSDNTFSIQISSSFLPYFYGVALLTAQPLPIGVIAPGCQVQDDGQGAYVSGNFTAQTLQASLMDRSSGYLFNPRVTSGPYTLTNYNANTGVAEFTVNERYLGNYEGITPHIEKLTFKSVQNATMISELDRGDIDLLNKVSGGDAIAQGQALSEINAITYLRTGFAFLAFACESGATASANVRKAIAYSLDKDSLMQQVTGGSARRVYGYYGLGQWMPIYNSNGLNMPQELATLDMPQNIDTAKQLLIDDGWTLNETGGAFVDGTDQVRYKDINGTRTALEIKWAKTSDSTVADAIEQALNTVFPQLGIRLTITGMPFNTMLQYYYRQEPREYNMFYLASNFTYVFDPYYDFNTGDAYQGMTNTTGLISDELMGLAKDMRETLATEPDAYVQKWLTFQKKFSELMPMVPLYSNVYFDFYSKDLQGYDIREHSSWALAIPYAYSATAGG